VLPSYQFRELIEVLRRNLSPPEGAEKHRQSPEKLFVGLQVSGELPTRCGSSVKKFEPFFATLLQG
jgi:hypothetical protein